MANEYRKRNYLVPLLRNGFGSLILLWFIWYLIQQRSFFKKALDISFYDASALTLLILLSWLMSSIQNYILCRQAGAKIGFSESYILTLATTFGNHLPMRAGTLLRIYYMKSKHDLSYIQFTSIFSLRLLQMLVAAGLCGTIATLTVVRERPDSLPLLFLFGMMITLAYLAFIWRPSTPQYNNTLLRLWGEFTVNIQILKRNPSVSAACIILFMLQLMMLGLRFQIVSRILEYDTELNLIIVMVSLASIASFTSITPGGLGLRESLMGYATWTIKSDFSFGALVGSVDRVILLMLTAVLGGGSFVWLWWQLNLKSLPKTP